MNAPSKQPVMQVAPVHVPLVHWHRSGVAQEFGFRSLQFGAPSVTNTKKCSRRASVTNEGSAAATVIAALVGVPPANIVELMRAATADAFIANTDASSLCGIEIAAATGGEQDETCDGYSVRPKRALPLRPLMNVFSSRLKRSPRGCRVAGSRSRNEPERSITSITSGPSARPCSTVPLPPAEPPPIAVCMPSQRPARHVAPRAQTTQLRAFVPHSSKTSPGRQMPSASQHPVEQVVSLHGNDVRPHENGNDRRTRNGASLTGVEAAVKHESGERASGRLTPYKRIGCAPFE